MNSEQKYPEHANYIKGALLAQIDAEAQTQIDRMQALLELKQSDRE